MKIQIKRIYDQVQVSDGWRVLADRLWPRGVAKVVAEVDEWAKEITPSTELRKWFSHDPGKWNEFQKEYRAELKEKNDDLAQLIDRCPKETLTLLFAAKDETHSHAVILKKVLDEMLLDEMLLDEMLNK
ncbi:MAG: hypothetical protein ACJAZP_001281 [Psychromonas sp.]|jgi:uncharacterized protein YeaO (DUF488 family)|uniref:DUF488 domain-containing protein n=1 Tax=Psychromonas sp. TaxID=1884585 RepID=UPI0039E3999C